MGTIIQKVVHKNSLNFQQHTKLSVLIFSVLTAKRNSLHNIL